MPGDGTSAAEGVDVRLRASDDLVLVAWPSIYRKSVTCDQRLSGIGRRSYPPESGGALGQMVRTGETWVETTSRSVPDPSGVSTEAELAESLKALLVQRGLTQAGLSRAVRELPPMHGRTPLLPRSTLSDLLSSGRTTKETLLLFLAGCRVTQADVPQWVAAWERAQSAHLDRPPGARRVRDLDPRTLGVHSALDVSGSASGGQPTYVERDTDVAFDGVRGRLAALSHNGGFLLLVGDSSAGKTRCAYEAVRHLLPDWWLVHPDDPEQIRTLAEAPPVRTIVWLDETQRYLDSQRGLNAGTVRALLRADHPVVLIGTIWPSRYNSYSRLPRPDETTDPYPAQREVLKLAEVIHIDSIFSEQEQARAQELAAHDPRIRAALETRGYGLTQTIAGVPALVKQWRTADPYATAMITAAVDATRLGVQSPLAADLLRDAAPGYCTNSERATAPADWFERALAHATAPLHGQVSVLAPQPTSDMAMGSISGYTVTDYLLQRISEQRQDICPPGTFWDACLRHLADEGDISRIAVEADNRLRYTYAIPLFLRETRPGDAIAPVVARRLGQMGRIDEAIELLGESIEYGNTAVALCAIDLLSAGGRPEEAIEGLRRVSSPNAHLWVADLLEKCGRIDEAIAALCGDYRAADCKYYSEHYDPLDPPSETRAREIAELLARHARADELQSRAEAGDEYAIVNLAVLTAKQGDHETGVTTLRSMAKSGNGYAQLRLAQLYIDLNDPRKAIKVLRATRGMEDIEIAKLLDELLLKVGDEAELRARCVRDDYFAFDALTGLMAKEGKLDEALATLRKVADPGNNDYEAFLTAQWIAKGLRENDQDDLAQRLMAFGLTADGVIADTAAPATATAI